MTFLTVFASAEVIRYTAVISGVRRYNYLSVLIHYRPKQRQHVLSLILLALNRSVSVLAPYNVAASKNTQHRLQTVRLLPSDWQKYINNIYTDRLQKDDCGILEFLDSLRTLNMVYRVSVVCLKFNLQFEVDRIPEVCVQLRYQWRES